MTTMTASPVRPTRSVPASAFGGIGALCLLVAYTLMTVAENSNRGLILFVSGLLYLVFAPLVVLLVQDRRQAVDRLFTSLTWGAFLLALFPLISVLSLVVTNGAKRFDVNFLQKSLSGVGPLDSNGGAYHAIIGTLEQVGLASVMSIPVGLFAAIYLVEHGRGPLVPAVRFVTDVMTGVPSIVAGLFVFSFWVIALGKGFSGFAAALSLAILMLPTIVRTTEVVLGLVPDTLREASLALGVARWRTVVSVVLPAASSGIITGILLAVARVAGETAPLLLTALNFDSINADPFSGQQGALPSFIFAQAGQPQQSALDRAWAGALTLLLLILALNVVARVVASRTRIKA